MTYPQHFVKSLAPLRYKTKSQYFPTQNISPLDADALHIDISGRGKYPVPIKNMEVWEKRALSPVAINSHADLFSSAAYQCLQQEPMSFSALSRLLEAVAKSIKHATAMSTILAIELFQAQRDAAIASSKILLDYSSHALRNVPINSQLLFHNKIKRVAKSNLEAQQHGFLASYTNNLAMQPQKSSYTATSPFRKPRQPTKSSRPKQNQPYRSNNQSQSFMSNTRKDFPKRSSNVGQFPSCKPDSSSTKF